MVKQRVTVTQENSNGRNTRFHVNVTGTDMTRAGFVRQIQNALYDDYYVRDTNCVPTLCSKPDSSKSNNLE